MQISYNVVFLEYAYCLVSYIHFWILHSNTCYQYCRYWYNWLYKSTSIILWHPWIQTISWACVYSWCSAKLPEFGYCWYAIMVYIAISKVWNSYGVLLVWLPKLVCISSPTFVINHNCLHEFFHGRGKLSRSDIWAGLQMD